VLYFSIQTLVFYLDQFESERSTKIYCFRYCVILPVLVELSQLPLFFMLNFIYFHFQIAIVKVLYEIRLLSGKSYWKYGCKWRWYVRSLNWCVDSWKLWILDIEVINIFDSWFWINLDYNSSCCHSNLPGKERICSLWVYFYRNMMIFYDTDSGLKKKAMHAGMHYLERVKLLLPAEA